MVVLLVFRVGRREDRLAYEVVRDEQDTDEVPLDLDSPELVLH